MNYQLELVPNIRDHVDFKISHIFSVTLLPPPPPFPTKSLFSHFTFVKTRDLLPSQSSWFPYW